MRPMRCVLLAILLGIAATLASSCVPTETYTTYPDSLDCEQACRAAAAGWPFAYVVDGRVTSPIGKADLLSAMLGLDVMRWLPFAADCFSWTLVVAGCILVARRISGKSKPDFSMFD